MVSGNEHRRFKRQLAELTEFDERLLGCFDRLLFLQQRSLGCQMLSAGLFVDLSNQLGARPAAVMVANDLVVDASVAVVPLCSVSFFPCHQLVPFKLP